MASLKEKLWGRSSKELRPGERALPFHLVPAIIAGCESAWNKDPVFGVIGIQSGPRGQGSTQAS